MKFKVHTYDSKPNKNGMGYVGRFEIYNDKGECVAASGKRRVANYTPVINNDTQSLPIKFIKDIAGVEKKISVTDLDNRNGVRTRPRSRYARLNLDLDSTNEDQVYEVECV